MSLLKPASRRKLIRTPRMQFRQTGWTCVASNPRTLCSKSEISENLQKFQKIIFTFKMILWRHWVQFSILISLPESFSPSTVNVGSKFWKIWKKKRELSKIWIFDWSYETKTATFNFDNPAENFFGKHGNCSFKILKKLKKRDFKNLTFWLISWDEDCNFQFWYPCRKVFRRAR